jgi:hypothetical protein
MLNDFHGSGYELDQFSITARSYVGVMKLVRKVGVSWERRALEELREREFASPPALLGAPSERDLNSVLVLLTHPLRGRFKLRQLERLEGLFEAREWNSSDRGFVNAMNGILLQRWLREGK